VSCLDLSQSIKYQSYSEQSKSIVDSCGRKASVRPRSASARSGLTSAHGKRRCIWTADFQKDSLNSSSSQCVFTFTIIFLNFLYAWGSLTFSVGKINFCIVSYVIHFLHIMILKYNKGT